MRDRLFGYIAESFMMGFTIDAHASQVYLGWCGFVIRYCRCPQDTDATLIGFKDDDQG